MTTNEAHAPALNTLAYAILELLERKSLSGYDVKKRFLGSLAFGWHAHVSQLYPTLRQLEHSLIVDALARAQHNQTRAAALLGTSRQLLKYRMTKLGIALPRYTTPPVMDCSAGCA